MRAQGYDRTIGSSEDEFGRSFLVDNIYSQLMSLDVGWSVRVALNGDWGSGKTSIAEMIESRARDAGHPVGWLFPWRVNSTKNVASALMATVLTALEEAKIELSMSNAARKKLGGALDFLERFKELHPAAELGLSLLEDTNSFDAAFAAPIAEQLAHKKKRLLIIIDDLDRCDPTFLPPLLLFMRTALDIPGFSFLAPFDSDIVAKTIHASNPAWTNADRFLEKVFDFRVPIPDLSNEQKSRFTVSQLAKAGLYVSDRDVSVVATLLPGTPRALKALVRDIAWGKAEIERRGADEISWPMLLAIAMLRATSLEFFRTYRREVVDEAQDLDSWRKARKCDFQTLWQLVGHTDEGSKRRVARLVRTFERIDDESSLGLLRRTFHFTDEHEPVTWKEFEQFVSRWSELGLEEAMAGLAVVSTAPRFEVAAHLASLAITGYQRVLERLPHTAFDSLRDERINEVHRGQGYLALGLELLTAIGNDQPNQRFDLFARLLVTVHDSDRSFPDTEDLHGSARRLLEALCTAASDDWPRYDEGIASMLGVSKHDDNFSWSSQTSVVLRNPMRSRAREELLLRLDRTAGLDGLFRNQTPGLMAQIFLDPADSFWEAAHAPARFGNPQHCFEIQENARSALQRIIECVRPGGDDPMHWSIMRSVIADAPAGTLYGQIAHFLACDGPLGLVWRAYVCGPTPIAEAEVEQTQSQLLQLGASQAAFDKGASA